MIKTYNTSFSRKSPHILTVIDTDIAESEGLIRQMAKEHQQANPDLFAGLRAGFKGIVAIEATQWLGHEREEYFTVLLKYLYDHRHNWHTAIILHDCKPAQLQQKYTPVILEPDTPLEAGGLPVMSDGVHALINTEYEHSLIYGGTASKKTRTLIVPLIEILAQARESMVIMDIKGELSDGKTFPHIRRSLEVNGYKCLFFNLRDMNGDAYNPLLEPYRLYRSGRRDEAIRMCNDIVDALAGIYHGSTSDPFWELTAKLYLASVMVLMYELCADKRKIDMLTLASYTDWNSSEDMRRIADLIKVENNIMTMLRSVTSEPERTKMSTLATVNSMMTDFLTNEKLLKMLSNSTFDLHKIGQEPTALFIILPDGAADTVRDCNFF